MVIVNKYKGMSHEQLMQSIFTARVGKDCRQLHRELKKAEKKAGIPIFERQGICFAARYPRLTELLFMSIYFVPQLTFIVLKKIGRIEWNWIWVFSPLWILIIFVFVSLKIGDFLISKYKNEALSRDDNTEQGNNH